MAHHEARVFPKIKEVRTFLIEGVGSGGDYHNVLRPICYQKNSFLMPLGQRWTLAH